MKERAEGPFSQERPEYVDWPHVAENLTLQTSLMAAVAAGDMLREAYYSGYESHVKADRSEYTPFDVQAEEIAARVIRRVEPQAAIMGEEIAPDADVSGGEFWAIDGIDGTTNFSRRLPFWNFTMVKVVDGKTSVGVVNYPLGGRNESGQIYYAVEGEGAYLNGELIQVANRPFNKSLITFSPLLDVREGKEADEDLKVKATWRGMEDIVNISKRFPREVQSGGLELAWVASGNLDGVATSWTNPWDLSGGVLEVKEAGGIVTNIYGEDWQPSYHGVIAGSPRIQPIMLRIIQEHFIAAGGSVTYIPRPDLSLNDFIIGYESAFEQGQGDAFLRGELR